MMKKSKVFAAATLVAGLALTLSACGGGDMAGMDHGGNPMASASASAGHDMAGMDHGGGGMGAAKSADGLAAESGGYRFDSKQQELPAGAPTEFRFTVAGSDGKPLTAFEPEQTKLMHFYAIRSDLSGFQHLHPTMAADGTWTAPLAALAALEPGRWRVCASFVPGAGMGKGTGLVLSRTVSVPGPATSVPLPAAAAQTTVDGYTVAVEGALSAGKAGELKVTVSKDGKPVTDLQPYLETYAHLTAFRGGDQAFAHLHPETQASGAGGGPTLPFHAELGQAGDWRLFLQFQTGGTLHTAALTLTVGK